MLRAVVRPTAQLPKRGLRSFSSTTANYETLREIEQRDMIRKANSAFSVDTDDHARIQWPSPLRTPDPDYPALPSTISALKRMSENDLLALSSAHTSVLRSAWIDYGKRGGDLRRELPIRIASSVGFRLGH